jgi:16S rRNA (cytidine1402-2'-O)-methyltransferase
VNLNQLPAVKLFIVGTPIGHLQDLTYRAEEVLRTAAVIACEDTRVTHKLLERYKINTPTVSLHHHSPLTQLDEILERVRSGERVAVVTDAGMPGLSDPGGLLVARAAAMNVPVEVIPGPSALTAATAISGLPTDKFLFLGFLPHKKGRQTLFRRIAETEETVIIYESPHRLLKTLQALIDVLTESRQVVVCRELTKIHESVVRGTAVEVMKHFNEQPDEVRGEIVILIGPRP